MIFFLLFSMMLCYLPVVMIHGYKGSFNDWNYYLKYIEENHPGTKTFPLKFFPGDISEKTNLFEQTSFVVEEIKKLQAQNNFTKFILIGHSQGGLIARSASQIIGGDDIDTFISLSGVQAGYFGNGKCGEKHVFPEWLLHEGSKVIYTKYIQEHYSFSNFWNDPESHKRYLEECKYLTKFNNESSNPESFRYKSNFIKIRKLVFFGGPQDECIKPWESALFGFYALDDIKKIESMKEREVYKLDSFGLRTIDEEGRLEIYSIGNMKHIMWIQDEEFFKSYILKLLL